MPHVFDVLDFDEAIQFAAGEKRTVRPENECLILFPWELETSRGIQGILESPGFSEVMCFIGLRVGSLMLRQRLQKRRCDVVQPGT